eukprot:CAMPEP_0194326058 /NCGR_PEP_ID=MMETSP0171-20130528/34499_1 /TAXON_ID=218684 /ORGANISM="Corethron pennatum, Strain L29A3" /LENGTH=512 /DNA_ID=CAMNT_0039085489 /DNA_START=54 /DNA_END=1589 /DNA_ORIENTATION=+
MGLRGFLRGRAGSAPPSGGDGSSPTDLSPKAARPRKPRRRPLRVVYAASFVVCAYVVTRSVQRVLAPAALDGLSAGEGAAGAAASDSGARAITPADRVGADGTGRKLERAGEEIPAGEELACRSSILDFLVNATDVDDECDALQRAYTISCSIDDDGVVDLAAAPWRKLDSDVECCRSIVRVYHDRCDSRLAAELTDRNLLVIVMVLCLCGFVRSYIRRFEINYLPEVAGCILVGVVGGIIVDFIPGYNFSFDEKLFLRVLLPPIVFEAALSIDKPAFRRHVIPILGYAIVGTVFSSALVAVIVHVEGTLPWVECFAFGTLISSIDPVATLAVLNAIGINETETLYILIFGEALLNDGVAVVGFETLIHFMDDNIEVNSAVIWNAVFDFFKVATGSIFVGIVSGVCCTLYYRAVKGWQTPLIEVLLFFLWSLIPYYICDLMAWSGIVSIVVMGFVMDMYIIGSDSVDYSLPNVLRRVRPLINSDGCLSDVGTKHVRFVIEVISTLMETTIFA